VSGAAAHGACEFLVSPQFARQTRQAKCGSDGYGSSLLRDPRLGYWHWRIMMV